MGKLQINGDVSLVDQSSRVPTLSWIRQALNDTYTDWRIRAESGNFYIQHQSNNNDWTTSFYFNEASQGGTIGTQYSISAAGGFVGNLSGNAATATKLATARTISLTGSVTGSGSFDGSGNLSISTTTNHSHSYLPLSGGTMNGTAIIKWADAGNWNVSGVTFPVKRGGLYWSGQSDWIDFFAEESSSDMLNLIAQFGDDSSSGIKIRTHTGTDVISIMANGTITATTFSGTLSGNATSASSVPWSGVTGKPSSFTPSTNSNDYVRVYNSNNVGGSSTVTMNDLAKQHFAAAMIHAAEDNPTGAAGWCHAISMAWGAGSNTDWISQLAFGVQKNDGLWYRTNSSSCVGKGWKRVLDSSNYTSYTVTKTGGGASGTWGINVTGQATYVRDSYNGSNITITYGKSGQSSTSWLASWNGYELGAIQPSNITAGWASGASYSNSSNALASTGWGNGNFTYLQTSGDFYGNSGWSHYLISNHGNGETYYNFVIALPFWSYPKYKRMSGGSAGSWYNFHTTENVIIQNATPGAGFYGQIWFKI